MSTPYHTAYYAYELRKRCAADSPDKLAEALLDAKVELNPHQVEAALFAFQSPLSKGAILADEVGLGKTIEAGLLLSQKWAERRHESRLLVITPANLRKQWHQELFDKFFLPCQILEAKSYRELRKEHAQPFALPKIVICSYQFARAKAEDIKAIHWDLVVVDEAHRLRNVYKPSAVIARTLKDALGNSRKVLLTATPLQNSLLELFGLVSVIDDHTFGDLRSFREQFSNLNDPSTFDLLKARIQPLVQRTLRREVKNINFTKRIAIVQRFTPADSEHRLYNLVSDYLQRDNLAALPASQRKLMTLVLRKLLASSSFAIAGALDTLANRLREKIVAGSPPPVPLAEKLDEDFEALDEMEDEWDSEGDDATIPLSSEECAAIQREITDLEQFRQLAVSIEENAKGQAMLTALQTAFARAPELKALPKALVFTESRKTQDYLIRLLEKSPWKDGLVLFNGSNNDPRSRAIYNAWHARHKDTDRVTGSRTADMRSALVDYFRDEGTVMVATEAGAEGINLQFCSFIVNYDLPWNPQRVEQRIGRCHRYGQKSDVVVVNFLNEKNEADQRVYELLAQKFQLFEGVFGASDEVLGAIESGVDFEKRIAAIYQRCRTPDEIKQSFEQLQLELGAELADSLSQTRKALIENFDDEVREKVRIHAKNSRDYRTRYEELLMQLTRHELSGFADFIGTDAFQLNRCPVEGPEAAIIPLGRYELPRRSDDAHFYRLGHPLADALIHQAKERPLPLCEIAFDYQSYSGQNTLLEAFVGHAGWLTFSVFTVAALDQTEDYLLFAALSDDGRQMDSDTVKRLLTNITGRIGAELPPDRIPLGLATVTSRLQDDRRRIISTRNAELFEKEAAKLDAWADDLKVALERDIKDLDRLIKEARRAALAGLTLEDKLAAQKQIKTLEAQRSTRRRALFDAQDAIDVRRGDLIATLEGKLEQSQTLRSVFTIRWSLV